MSSRIWSAARDHRLRLMRLEGESWEEIEATLAVSQEAARARADRIGALAPIRGSTIAMDPDREPLPAGHPRSWGILTEGTWLAGTRYPFFCSGYGL